MMTGKLLVVGSFRGGLGYVRELLTRAGCVVGDTFNRQTMHEHIDDLITKSLPVEVSPYVVPYLNHPRFKEHKVVYVLRDPRMVIGSLLRAGYPNKLAGPKPRWDTIARWTLPGYADKYLVEGCEANATLSLVHNWAKLAKTLRPDMSTVQLEHGPLAVLQATIGWSPNKHVPYCPTDINKSADDVVSLQGLGKNSEEFKANLDTLLNLHGYYSLRVMPAGGHAHYTNPSWHC